MPKYVGQPCTSCRKVFTEDDEIVVCPECGSPYHKECYKLEGKCINTLLHESGSEWHPEPVVAPIAQATEIVCPNCGTHNSPENFFCTSCGIALRSERSDSDSASKYNDMTNAQHPDYNNPVNSQQQYQNQQFPYFSPALNYQTVDENAQVDSNTAGEYMKYVGMKFYYYLPKFMKFANGGSKVSLNFAALLFPHIWFFYRKMPLHGAIILLLNLLTSLPIYIYGFNALSQNTVFNGVTDSGIMMISGLCSLAAWAIDIICGLFGNYFYYKKAKKDIDTIKSSEVAADSVQSTIASKGGVSIAYVVISIVVTYIIGFIILSLL